MKSRLLRVVSNSPDHLTPESGTYFCGNCGDRFQLTAGKPFTGCSHCQFPVAWRQPPGLNLLGTNPSARQKGFYACGNCGCTSRLDQGQTYPGCKCWHDVAWHIPEELVRKK